MIDSTSEVLLTFPQAAEEIPRRRRGRKCHVSTLYRWATVGCRGVVLETLQCGGTLTTSREALQRFFEALTVSRESARPGLRPGPTEVPVRRSRARRLRDSERAARELEAMGA